MYRRTPIFFRIADSFFRHQLLFWSALLIVSGLTMAALYARSKTFHASAMTQVQQDTVRPPQGWAGGDATSWVTPAQKKTDQFNELIKQNQPGGFLDTALRNAHLGTPDQHRPPGRRPALRHAPEEPERERRKHQPVLHQPHLGQPGRDVRHRHRPSEPVHRRGRGRPHRRFHPRVHFLDSQIARTKASLQQCRKGLVRLPRLQRRPVVRRRQRLQQPAQRPRRRSSWRRKRRPARTPATRPCWNSSSRR